MIARIRHRRPSRRSASRVWWLFGGTLYMLAISAVLVRPYELAGLFVVAHVLVIPCLAFAHWVLAREPDPWIARVIIAGLVAKLVGSFARYGVAFDIYGGNADASRYANVGKGIAQDIHSGGLGNVIAELSSGTEVLGTRFIELLTGIVFAVIGPTTPGGFLVFSWMGFCGLYLFFRAFTIALPQANRRRYAALVFLLPSLLFWPSSIGKEAWMMFGLGLTAYGIARYLGYLRHGIPLIVLGLLACTAVRPHISLALLIALLVAYVTARRPTPAPQIPLSKLVAVTLMLGALGLLLSTSEQFFDVELANPTGVTEVLDRTQEQTTQGGSEFDVVGTTSPVQIPLAAITVLFRPLIFEAGSPLRLAVSLEGTFLLLLMLRSWREMIAAVRARPAYVVFGAVYALLFIIAFSSIGNFGILARQRVQLLPLFTVLVCVPRPPARIPEAPSLSAARARFS